MRDHVRILGILNIVMGGLTALIGVVALVAMGGVGVAIGMSGADGNGIAPFLPLIGFGIAVFFLALGLPSIIGGWGLLRFRPWARILTLIVSVFYLFHLPIGTALGVYGLWVLLSDEARLLFEGRGQLPATPAAAGFPVQPAYPAQAGFPQPGVYPTQPGYPASGQPGTAGPGTTPPGV